MRTFLIICLIPFLLIQSILAQHLPPLESSKNHYTTLLNYSSEPTLERSSLDTLQFFPEQYNAVAILYSMLDPTYLTEEQVEKLKNSVQFPANSSVQTAAELEFLMDWQRKRTSEQIERAAKVLAPIGYWPHIDAKEDHPDHVQNLEHLFFVGREIIGDKVTAENYPSTLKLLKGITTDMRIMEFTIKYHLLRARPYVLEPELEPLQIMSSPSFASGHTLWAYLHAYTWSMLVPDQRAAFLDLAYEIGESREIMGIHYPSDEEASRVIAYKMLEAMLENVQFINDLEMAKQEWKDN